MSLHKDSMVRGIWIGTMHRVHEKSTDEKTREVALFAANVLEKCDPTPELNAYLDAQALVVLDND